MAAITDDILSKVANVIGGEDAVKVVMALRELKEVTDDQLLSKTEMKLNDIRKILFKLYNHSIVQCNSSRDKDTGWFIFKWRVQPDQVEGFINNQKRRILKILKSRLEYEEKNEFYYCYMPECRKITFDDAVELIFRCPTCGKALQHYDNSAMVKALADKIEQLEGKKVEVGPLSSDAPRKLIPVCIDSNTGQLLVMKEKHNEKLRQVFVSHSSKDKELIDIYRSYFDDTGVKQIFMKYEKWSRKDEPNWKWINRHIKESDALWVILTRNIVDLKNPIQTQNCVSYEIGVASACEPRKPVYVWREEPINFPVPYLDHYIPYSIHLEKKDEKWWSEEYGRIFKEHYSTVTKQIITSPTTYENDTKTPKVQCNNCKTTFCYHGTDYRFNCPCCSRTIDTITQRVE